MGAPSGPHVSPLSGLVERSSFPLASMKPTAPLKAEALNAALLAPAGPRHHRGAARASRSHWKPLGNSAACRDGVGNLWAMLQGPRKAHGDPWKPLGIASHARVWEHPRDVGGRRKKGRRRLGDVDMGKSHSDGRYMCCNVMPFKGAKCAESNARTPSDHNLPQSNAKAG